MIWEIYALKVTLISGNYVTQKIHENLKTNTVLVTPWQSLHGVTFRDGQWLEEFHTKMGDFWLHCRMQDNK